VLAGIGAPYDIADCCVTDNTHHMQLHDLTDCVVGVQWPVPEPGEATALTQPGAIKLGIALEPLGELLRTSISLLVVIALVTSGPFLTPTYADHYSACSMVSGGAGELQQKEGSKLNAKADFAKLVALNLFHFMVRQASALQCIAAAGLFMSESDRQVRI
jgi:hypothetical protein